jgi:hypothetical protein
VIRDPVCLVTVPDVGSASPSNMFSKLVLPLRSQCKCKYSRKEPRIEPFENTEQMPVLNVFIHDDDDDDDDDSAGTVKLTIHSCPKWPIARWP